MVIGRGVVEGGSMIIVAMVMGYERERERERERENKKKIRPYVRTIKSRTSL